MAKEEIIFPNNIRTLRLAAGFKMTELARKTKMSLSAMSKIEKGVRRLNQKQLLNVCSILGCKLSDIFIKESDAVADQWQSEIKRRLNDNEGSGLKIFGTGIRKIRQQSGKTIAQAAKDAGMTLSVYHKIEVGQREIYENEIEPLAKSFAFNVESLFDKIANLYKSGELANQITKVKERVKSVLEPNNPASGFDIKSGVLGAKLYDDARKKLIPVFGFPSGKEITFKKSDKVMIEAPATIEGRAGVYAIRPNTKRTNGIIPENSYVFADFTKQPEVGDLVVCIDSDFEALSDETPVSAQIAVLRKDSKGNVFAQIFSPEEKIIHPKTLHKVIMIDIE